MNLYRKLFGLCLMTPAGESDGGGGALDRGDSHTPTDDTPPAAAETGEEDVKVALGETAGEEAGEEEGQPRDAAGKFAKKEGAAPTIPKSRFDDAVARERARAEAAERELADIRKAQQQIQRGIDLDATVAQVTALRAKEHDALIDGDKKTAAEIAAQIDTLNRQIAVEQAKDMSAAAREQAREEIRWDLTIERIEEQYPALNDKSDEFDQDLTDDVVDKMNGLIARERLPRSEALLRAVREIMHKRAPAEPAAESKGLDRGKQMDRKAAAVAKNVDAAKRQPASTKQIGADSDKHGQTAPVPSATDMTYAEFSALPESTKAKMRGDFVE